MPTDGEKRLHVTPLDPALLDAILKPSVRALATDVSFHSVQTFPENCYGFFTLPTMEADKLTKKLNGAILKGKSLKIQEAKTKRGVSGQDDDSHKDRSHRADRESRRRKGLDDAIPGYELPTSRKVKRGWTEEPVKDKKKRKADGSDAKGEGKKRKSQQPKYTDREECLFRTVPPSNKRDISERDEKRNDKKKSRKAGEGLLVHEFKNTTPQPTFIREGDSASKMTMSSEFVEGKGWIDRSGNLKEPSVIKANRKQSDLPGTSSTTRMKTNSKGSTNTAVEQTSSETESEETSSSGTSDSSSEEGEEGITSRSNSVDDVKTSGYGQQIQRSSRETSSSSTRNTDKENVVVEEKDAEQSSAYGPDQLSTPKQNHPQANSHTDMGHLTTLFKPPPASSNAKPMLEINTQFNFFGGADEDDIEDDAGGNDGYIHQEGEPHTPFTKLHMQARNLRSGAPTPDTAAVGRTRFWERDPDDDNGNDMDASPRPAAVAGKPGKKEESDFAKWFWENRGDNNRAWKRRRREAAKEKRQKENRKRGSRGK